jgi:hypothetical protein
MHLRDAELRQDVIVMKIAETLRVISGLDTFQPFMLLYRSRNIH